MKRILATLLALVAFSASAYQLTTPAGLVEVGYSNIEGIKPTYSAVAADVAPVATATDVVVISASATKTIRITNIKVTGDATGNNTIDVYVYKRTAANTGGTTSPITIAKHDSVDPAPTATVVKYTANATGLGTGTLIRAAHMPLPATSNPTVTSSGAEWVMGDRAAKTLVLRAATAESIAVGLGGNAVPAGTQLYVQIEWTEE